MTGAYRLPWRFACPEDEHQGLRSRRYDGGFRCQSCKRTFPEAIDLKEGDRVSLREAKRRIRREGPTP